MSRSSHIKHMFRNVVGGAVVRKCPQATDASSSQSLALIARCDSALADACRVGLRSEFLSANLEQDQPDGVLCMQPALIDPVHAAMLLQEMLVHVCTNESDVAADARLVLNHPRATHLRRASYHC